MPNVLSTLAGTQWGPLLKQWTKSYMTHRDSVRRVLILLFFVRTFLTIRQVVKKFQRGSKQPRKPKLTTTDDSKPTKKRKGEVKERGSCNPMCHYNVWVYS